MKEAKSPKKAAPKKDTPSKPWMGVAKHIGVYFFLWLVAMFYFKPVAFEGKSLQQHDNVNAVHMQKEFFDYLYSKEEGKTNNVYWSNQAFMGMPTSIFYSSHNPNYCKEYVMDPVRLGPVFGGWHEYAVLAFLMLGVYLGIIWAGGNWLIAFMLALMYGFLTSNTLYISAGHTGKMVVLATVPALLGALLFAYRSNLLLGASLFAMVLCISISSGHVQMLYYTMLAFIIIGIALLYNAFKQSEIASFSKFTVVMIVGAVLGVVANTGYLLGLSEYSSESTRGRTELSKKEQKEGLATGYIFDLSIEKMETAALMFPNFYGGTQGKSFFSKEGSATSKAVYNPAVQQGITNIAKSNGWDPNQFLNQVINQYTRQYRGSQRMSGGPIYFGVVCCFLLILSLFLVQGVLKWGIVSSLLFLLVLAWGQHIAFVGDFMYHYFPLYNKFRDTKMTLLVGQPIAFLLMGLGAHALINFDPEKYNNTLGAKLLPRLKQTVSKEGYVVLAGAVTLGICVWAWLYGAAFDPASPKDDEIFKISPDLLRALYADRSALIQSDALRAIGFTIATLIPMYLYAKGTIKELFMFVGIGVIACIDLGFVNSDYLNKDSYKEKPPIERAKIPPTKADQEILQDKSYYRVADYSENAPSQSARACQFHKSVGGYFAAKPLLYQELWNGYQMDNKEIALKQRGNIFNMLNVKYFILDPNTKYENPSALGNAWFVDKVEQVANADEEIESINDLVPQTVAVTQKKNAAYLEGLTNTKTPSDRIFLTRYHPDTLVYTSETTNERFAVFSEIYYPPEKGWDIYINDQKVDPFIKVDYLLRGLRVPAGKNTIKMVFAPKSIVFYGAIGSWISLLIILGVVGAAYLYFKSESNKEDKV